MGYILNDEGDIERLTYQQYLNDFGTDETTTPRGIGSRLFLDGKTLCTWGVGGNNYKRLKTYPTISAAKKELYEQKEAYVESDWNCRRFFTTKAELYKDLSERYQKPIAVIKRYFRYQKYLDNQIQLIRDRFAKTQMCNEDDIKQYVKQNLHEVKVQLTELDKLKKIGNKELWQVKANSLVQKVSKNDFRYLKWSKIYKLIRETA